MKIITINLAEKYLSGIKILNDLGIYQSRSEAIRIALKDFLLKEQNFYDELEDDRFKTIIESSIKNRK